MFQCMLQPLCDLQLQKPSTPLSMRLSTLLYMYQLLLDL